MLFVIAYDVADPRRLRRVARVLEKHALRCQKSVFLFEGDEAAVERLLDEVARRLDAEADVVQAWRLVAGQPRRGRVRGTPLPVLPDGIILEPDRRHFVGRGDGNPGNGERP